KRFKTRLRCTARRQLLDERGALVEPDLPAGDGRPVALFVLVEVLRIDALPFPGDHGEPATDVGGDRDEPRGRSELATCTPLDSAARSGGDAGGRPVKVGIEQGRQRDPALVAR